VLIYAFPEREGREGNGGQRREEKERIDMSDR
jgi:hypothetical protein